MSIAMRINEELYRQSEQAAKADSRTAPLESQYWARIGKASLDNPGLPIEFIRTIIDSKGQAREPLASEHVDRVSFGGGAAGKANNNN